MIKEIENKLTAPEVNLAKQIRKLTTSDKYKFTNVQEATDSLVELMNDLDLNSNDIEPDGANTILDRDSIIVDLESKIKDALDNHEDPDNPSVQDLAFAYRHDDDYLYVNGYGRVELVTDDDVLCELEDLLEYVEENL